MKTFIFFCLLIAFTLQGNAQQCASFVVDLKDTVIALETGGSLFEKMFAVQNVFASFKSKGASCKGLSKSAIVSAVIPLLPGKNQACGNALAGLATGVEANIDKNMKGFKAFKVVAKVIPEIMAVAGFCSKGR